MNIKNVTNITKDNKLEALLGHMNAHLDMFTSLSGLVGITLNGGLSRGYGDHLSEIDLTIYLDSPAFAAFSSGRLELKEGICVIDKQLYDIKVVDFDSEKQRTFSPIVELWDLSYARILYDPNNLIAPMIEDKLKTKITFDHMGGPMFDAWWHFRLAGDIWIHREDAVQGHMMLNEAAKSLLKTLYIANLAYVPHEKWLAHMIQDLDWLPYEHGELKKLLFSTGDLSLQSVIQRQADINDIWDRVNNYALEATDDKTGIDMTMGFFFNRTLKVLEKDSYTLEEFEEIAPLRSIHSDPLAEFVKVVEDRVVVDRSKFMSLDKDSMYSWHYQVAKAVQGQTA